MFLLDGVKILLDGMNMKRLILTLFLIVVIFISGCVEQNGQITPEYKDEALKMQIEIPDKVLPSQGINMKVYVTNQVKDEIKNIYFRVTDFYGLNMIDQICPNNQ
jgi:Na+-transporting methylmalonyl-CoA/oxaloacetate decarboxylase gamma subunit